MGAPELLRRPQNLTFYARLFASHRIPAALPQIFSSLRIAMALAWVTLVVAELMNPRMPSLGYLLTLGSAFTRVQTIFVGIIVIGSLVLLFDVVAMSLYNRATSWMKRTVEYSS
jgi:sulfonate transport system permease protein